MTRKSIDLIGQKFGKLYVLSRGPNKGVEITYNTLCDCGIEKLVLSVCLRRGNTRSCGCLRKEIGKIRIFKEKQPTIHKKSGSAGFSLLFKGYERGAEKRNLPFELTKEQFAILTLSVCEYCGQDPKSIIKYSQGKLKTIEKSEYIYNGIDRKNNNLGYTVDNCVPCCKQCNYSKRDMGFEEWISWISGIANKQSS